MLAFLLSFLFAFQAQDSLVTKTWHSASHPAPDSIAGRYVEIDNIFIIGNKQTKERIILREMTVAKGDFYYEEDLKNILVKDRSKIINTRLFNTVELTSLELSKDKVDIVVRVTERWYTFPSPIFDIVDRNFNDWWQNQNHDFRRVNYGLRLHRNNMRGRNERLTFQGQLGYTKQFHVGYKMPYIDRSQRHGLSLLVGYSENKNIAYETVEHKRLFFDSEELLRVSRIFAIGYQFRKSFYTTHSVNIAYGHNEINDTIAAINPRYYLNGRTSQRLFSIGYDINIDKRDNNSYPLHGHKTSFFTRKYGLGIFDDINQFDFGAKHSQYMALKRNFYLSNYTSAYISGPQTQPYAHLRGLGYKSDFIRGYELYVVEGQTFYLNRTTFKKQLFSSKTRLGFIPLEQFRNFPLAIYIKTYFDMGYVENFENYGDNIILTDRYLFGTGLGLDIVTYYDTVIRFEYSINREKEAGLFLHLKKEF